MCTGVRCFGDGIANLKEKIIQYFIRCVALLFNGGAVFQCIVDIIFEIFYAIPECCCVAFTRVSSRGYVKYHGNNFSG